MKQHRSYKVKWEIDIDSTSPEEAAKLALEIQRDPNSEAVNFDVKEQATSEVTNVDLMDEQWDITKGSDICYGCGKAQEYQTMQDVDETFAIYCDPCHTKEVAKRNIIEAINELEGALDSNSVRSDWTDDSVSMEMDWMYGKVHKIKKDLEKLK